MKNKGLIITILIVLIGIGGYFVWKNKQNDTQNNDKEVVKVGVILPLTGELGNFGKTVLNGINLNLEKYNRKSVKLVVEDSKGNPKNAVSSIEKLISQDVKFIIGSLTSGATLAINPLSKKNKIFLISPTASTPDLSNSNPYFFRVWQSDNYDGQVAARFSYNELGLKEMNIFYMNNDYCNGLKDVFAEEFINLGGKINEVIGYQENEKLNIETIISNMKKQKVQGVYIPAHPKGIALFLRKAKEQNFNSEFISNVSAEDKDFIKIAGNASENLYFTAPSFDINNDNKNIKNFVVKYKKEYNEIPDIHAVKGYECMEILMQGLAMSNTTPDKMRNFILSKKKFSTISGLLEFDSSGDVKTDVLIKQYQSNNVKIIKKAQ